MSMSMPLREATDQAGSSPVLRRSKAEVRAIEIRRLSKPFRATVLIGAVSLMAFVTFLSYSLDRHSIQSSEQIFRAMLGDRSQHLADITLEYGYWDDAVENLVDRLNMKWVEETFVDYMQKELQIEGVHLIDGDERAKLHVVGGKVAEADLQARYGEALDVLIGEARNGPKDDAPVPATGLVGSLARLYLASAVLMTTYNGKDMSTDHVLVFAQPINEPALAVMAEKYRLRDLRLSTEPPRPWEAGFHIESVDKTPIGYFVWNPDLPGVRLVPALAVGLLLVYASMFFSARLFFRRATELVKALEGAKLEADKAKELLADQARSDPLTGLGNRRHLDEKLAGLQMLDKPSGNYALLYADLDRFKEVNDTFGHETGDLVLQYVADSLRTLSNPDDGIFRLGGDEFVIMFGNASRERVLSAGRAIIDHFSKPLHLNDAICEFGASVGVAFSRNPTDLLREADVALYSAKRRGRGQMAVYSAELMAFKGVPVEDAEGRRRRAGDAPGGAGPVQAGRGR